MNDLLLWACVALRTSNMKFLRRRLADYVKNCTKKHCARAARPFFFIEMIKSMICGVAVAVAVLIF